MRESVKRKRGFLGYLVVAVVVMFCCADGAAAYIMQQNEYIYAKLGHPGNCRVGDQEYPKSGRWSVGTVLGDPDPNNPTDDNRPLIRESAAGSPCWNWGYTIIRVDEENIVYGDTERGAWGPAPYVGAYPYDDDVGFYLVGYWRARDANVSVKLKMSLVRDQVRFEYTIRNDDPEMQHSVGIRKVGDVIVDDTNTVAYPYVPGVGINVPEIDLRGIAIPDYFEVYDDPRMPSVIARNLLRGQDATPPDRVAIGELGNINSNLWTYAPIADRTVINHAWAIWWDEMVLQPGQTRTIVTYYGVGTATGCWTSGSPPRRDRYVVAVSSPRTVMPDGSGNLLPFTINAYVYNLDYLTVLDNVNLNLTLPEGLELTDDVDNSPTKRIPGTIQRETEGPVVRWRVRPTGAVAGPVTFMVSASGQPYVQKTVSRSIVLPATYTKKIWPDWQMLSVPYELKDPRPEFALLPVDPHTGQILTSGLQAMQWDTELNDYTAVGAIQPGNAFWLKFDSSSISQLTLKMPGTAVSNASPLPSNQSMPIELRNGWNQIGNPYIYPIAWGRVKVLNSSHVGPVSIEEAANRNWIRRTIYWYDVGKGEYDYSSSGFTELQPWQGYWIRALTACQLIIPPVEQVGTISTSSTTTLSRMAGLAAAATQPPVLDGWKLDLRARAGDTLRGSGTIGLDSRASDGYGPEDVERPPYMANYVNVGFVNTDWGENSGRFIRDIRRSGGDKSWEMEVATDNVNSDIVLTWPGINSIPKNYRLRLEDVETGARKDMRTTSSYRYNAGGSPTRRFRLSAESAGIGRLIVSGLNVSASRASGTATVSYSLSTDAVADVRVLSASGTAVANLATGRGVTRGISSVVWNYRNSRGEPVPMGSYIVEVVATTPEGEVAKALTPFVVAR